MMKRCEFYKDMVEAQNKVDRWNLKDNSLSRARNEVDCECINESLSRARNGADCECTEVVTENV